MTEQQDEFRTKQFSCATWKPKHSVGKHLKFASHWKLWAGGADGHEASKKALTKPGHSERSKHIKAK